tara:strand:+ start:28 stop:624 length:597 start_codon:yes stop_codon:yes gene_type:complete
MQLKHKCSVLIGEYPWASSLEKEVLPVVENQDCKQGKKTNVKATMSNWNITSPEIEKLKKYIKNEIGDTQFITKEKIEFDWVNFWAAVYYKGDYSVKHDHFPCYWSFVYFLKTKWYHSSLKFSDSGKKVRPKNGRYVIFPSYLQHHVPKHRYNNKRIVLAGNLTIVNQIYHFKNNLRPDYITENAAFNAVKSLDAALK